MSEKDQIRAHLENSADAGIAILRITHGQMIDVKPFDDSLAAEVIAELFEISSPALVAAEIERVRVAAGLGGGAFIDALNTVMVNLKIPA